MEFDFEPRVKLGSNRLIHYTQFHGTRSHSHTITPSGAVTDSERPYTLFASGSRKRLKESLSRWIQTIKFATQMMRLPVKPLNKHTFVTLTLSSPQIHCDKVLKRECLNLFLISLQKKFGTKNYIWKAEVQGNGNLHYHILQEAYIHHSDLRALWNRVQNKLGYVDEFEKRHNKTNPNSTDIHALRGVRNVEAYVGKYMSKNEMSRPVCGHVWGRNDGMSKLLPYSFTNDLDMHEWVQLMTDSIENRQFNGDRFSITTFKTAPNWRTLPEHHKKELKAITMHNLSCLRLV